MNFEYTRRDLLKKSVAGPLLVGTTGSVGLTRLVNAVLIDSSNTSGAQYKEGHIKEIYPEPVDLEHPHTISIKTVHMRLYSESTTPINGTWRFQMCFLPIIPAPKGADGVPLSTTAFQFDYPGIFPGNPQGVNPEEKANWSKLSIPMPANWHSIKKFTYAELQELNNGVWELWVDFISYADSSAGSNGMLIVDQGKVKPIYKMKVVTATQPEVGSFINKRVVAVTAQTSGQEEDKYGSTGLVAGNPGYHKDYNPGQDFWRLAESGPGLFTGEFEIVQICFAHQGHRTVNDNSAGPVTPGTGTTVVATVHQHPDLSGRRLWLFNSVIIYPEGLAKPRVQVGLLYDHIKGVNYADKDFRWSGNHDWSYPQIDAEAGAGFNGAGVWGTDHGTTFRTGWRPAAATSVLVKWAEATPEDLELTRIAQCGWVGEANNSKLSAIAVCQPGFETAQDGNMSPWVIKTGGGGGKVPPAINREADGPVTNGELLCGPGLFTSWGNGPGITGNNLKAGFWWQVYARAGADYGPTAIEINDHDPQRLWKNTINFKLIGPVDIKLTK